MDRRPAESPDRSVRRPVSPEVAQQATVPRHEAVYESRPRQLSQVAQESPAAAHLTQCARNGGSSSSALAGGLDQPHPPVDVLPRQTVSVDQPGLLVRQSRHTAGRGALGGEPCAASSKASSPVEDQQDGFSHHLAQP